MSKIKKYKVSGGHDNRKIDLEVTAYSKKQAKLKAAFNYGYFGNATELFIGEDCLAELKRRAGDNMNFY